MVVHMSSGTPKARKVHGCSWCPDPIPVGEEHQMWTFIDVEYDGWGTVRMHIDCYGAMDRAQADADYDDPFCSESHARGADCDH